MDGCMKGQMDRLMDGCTCIYNVCVCTYMYLYVCMCVMNE